MSAPDNKYIFNDKRVQSLFFLALLAGGYFYWTHEELRLPTTHEAAVMEEICPSAEAVIDSGEGFHFKHPEIPFARACKLYEDRSLVRADFWGIPKAERQDARNAILQASREKIAEARAKADAELAQKQAQLEEQRVASRNAADAEIAKQKREAAELQEYNKPENVLKRKELEELKAANQAAETVRIEREAAKEVTRLDRERKAAERVEAARERTEAARQHKTSAEQNVSPAPIQEEYSAPAKAAMICTPTNSSPYGVTYANNFIYVTGSVTGRTTQYPVIDREDRTNTHVLYIAAKRRDQSRTLYFTFDYSQKGEDVSDIRVKDGASDTTDKCTFQSDLSN